MRHLNHLLRDPAPGTDHGPRTRCHLAPALAFALAITPSIALAQTGPATVSSPESATTAAVAAIYSEYDRLDSPGCALGVVQDGELVHARGFGSANLDYEVPITPNTVFYAASVSKQFTAAAVAHAAKAGHLSLDDDVRKWFPELPDYGTPITVRHLIHHTSGLRDYLTLMRLAGMRTADVHTADEILELVARQRELNFEPGSDYLYSNTGYLLLSELIGRATGKSLREYTTEHFFEPLGMKNTHFHDDAGHVQKNRAYSYARSRRDGFRISFLANFDQVGSGGLYTTVEDLFRWDQNFDEPKVGGEAFIDQLHERFVLTSGDTLDYAFGLRVGEYRGLRTVGHTGNMMGFKAAFVRFPDERFSVLQLCNLGDIDPLEMAHRVADVYLEDRLAPRAAESKPADAPVERALKARPTLDAEALLAYTGAYYSEELDATYRVELRDDALVVRQPLSTVRLQPADADVFEGGSIELHFERSGDAIVGFRLMAGRVRNVAFVRRP